MSLISDSTKSKLEGVFDLIHDTFKIPVTVINKGKKTIVSSDPNYSNIYNQRPSQTSVQYSNNENTIYVRILYSNPKDIEVPDVSNNDILKLLLNNNEVRIKTTRSDYETYFKNSTKVEFDGKTFKLNSSPKFHGLFNRNYVTLFLKETD